jgi:DinB family protein
LIETVPSLKSIAENLVRAEKDLLTAADSVRAGQWKTSPGEGRWSAGELVCHLIMVERAIIKNAVKLLQSPPKPRPLSKRFHLPMALVEARIIRRKTPIPLDPALVCEKDKMLTQLREVRERTLVFMEETKGKDLRKYHMAHPFLGTLNTYQWFQMIASHEIRHTKQMREIAAALPKTVTALHK